MKPIDAGTIFATILIITLSGCSHSDNGIFTPIALPSQTIPPTETIIQTTSPQATEVLTASTYEPLFDTIAFSDVGFDLPNAILFANSPGDGEWHDISRILPDGTGLICITCDASRSFAQAGSSAAFLSPAWSKDGDSMAFVVQSDLMHSIFIYQNDSNHLFRLAEGQLTWYNELAWSPDGRFLAYSTSHGITEAICIMNIENNNSENGTDNCVTVSKINMEPAWSPDGSELLFSSGGGFTSRGAPQMDLYLWNIATDEITQFTNTPDSELMAKWSPDGSQLALIVRNNDSYVYSLYLADAEGNGRMQIPGTGDVRDFDWSPDGQELVYAELSPTQLETCDAYCNYLMIGKVIDLASEDINVLTDGTQWIGDPAWRPQP